MSERLQIGGDADLGPEHMRIRQDGSMGNLDGFVVHLRQALRHDIDVAKEEFENEIAKVLLKVLDSNGALVQQVAETHQRTAQNLAAEAEALNGIAQSVLKVLESNRVLVDRIAASGEAILGRSLEMLTAHDAAVQGMVLASEQRIMDTINRKGFWPWLKRVFGRKS